MTTSSNLQIPDMTGRTVIVTGANSGIGRAAAAAFAGAGARVVLAVRDIDRGRAAAATMRSETEVRRLDLASLDSVREFAGAWEGDISLLVNNAGVMIPPLTRTADGFELQFGTNHLGHFALTNLLLEHISARVVTVSSSLHRSGVIDFDDLNWERKPYKPSRAYAQSKLANLLFTSELQRRLLAAGSPVLATAAHPGYAATNLQGKSSNGLLNLLASIGNRTVAQDEDHGALPTIYAAVGGRRLGRQLRRARRLHGDARPAEARRPLRRSQGRHGRTSPLGGLGAADGRALPAAGRRRRAGGRLIGELQAPPRRHRVAAANLAAPLDLARGGVSEVERHAVVFA
jgi:NAD(P)-dependent dehydrogenase (short-subunit alcohol dehydrogenase family)